MSVDGTTGSEAPLADAVEAATPRLEPGAGSTRSSGVPDLPVDVAELDAIAWNLPGRRRELIVPDDDETAGH